MRLTIHPRTWHFRSDFCRWALPWVLAAGDGSDSCAHLPRPPPERRRYTANPRYLRERDSYHWSDKMRSCIRIVALAIIGITAATSARAQAWSAA